MFTLNIFGADLVPCWADSWIFIIGTKVKPSVCRYDNGLVRNPIDLRLRKSHDLHQYPCLHVTAAFILHQCYATISLKAVLGFSSDFLLYWDSLSLPRYVKTKMSVRFCTNSTLTPWLSDRLTDWLTDFLTYWLDGWLAGWLADWLTDWLNDWLNEWMTGWLNDWLADWLNNWLNGWLTDWMNEWSGWQWLTDWLNNWLAGRLTDGCEATQTRNSWVIITFSRRTLPHRVSYSKDENKRNFMSETRYVQLSSRVHHMSDIGL